MAFKFNLNFHISHRHGKTWYESAPLYGLIGKERKKGKWWFQRILFVHTNIGVKKMRFAAHVYSSNRDNQNFCEDNFRVTGVCARCSCGWLLATAIATRSHGNVGINEPAIKNERRCVIDFLFLRQ